MKKFIGIIEGLNTRIGRTVMWFSLGIVLVQFMVVLMRYVYGIGSIWLQESITYMHGFLFMLAAAYTLKTDGHVRVDIFYRPASERTKAIVNLFGSALFLLPMCALIFYYSYPYVIESWRILEGSPEASGIKGRYLQKTAILCFAVLMALQGLAMIARSILVLAGKGDELEPTKEEA